MQCHKCQAEMPRDEAHEHGGQWLCDDCYMDAMSPATGCDPWAVYTSRRLQDQDQSLTQVQETILQTVRAKGRATIDELLAATGLDEPGLQRQVVTLRHMELVGWERQEDKSLCLKSFAKSG